MGRIFISCDDASILSTRAQYNDLDPKENFRYKLHKSHCYGCRSFNKRNDSFQRSLNKLKWVKLSTEQKCRIKERLIEAMKG